MFAKFDNNILDLLQEIHNPVLDKIMVFITTLGNHGVFWLLIGVLLILLWKDKRECGLSVILSVAFGFLLGNMLLKNLIKRSRPCWVNPDIVLLVLNPTDYSFPSGHTISSFAAATAIFCYSKKLGITAYIVASAIAFSRLYLYLHYPTDVIAGVIVGISVAIAAVYIVNKYYKSHLGKI